MLPRTRIRLRLNDMPIDVAETVPATTTLLHWLREARGLTGTKEGCAEGDCGACTVVLEQGRARVPINACLVMLGQLHGASVRTVEGLAGIHPVQRALAEGHGTQCGFCTPGFVMAGWAYAREGGDLDEALAGNLCRCTGYRPIVAALAGLSDEGEAAPPLTVGAGRFDSGGVVFHHPTTMADLLALRAERQGAWLLAGGTDLGLAVAEGIGGPAELIFLLGVPALQTMGWEAGGLRVGAAVSYARLLQAVREDAGRNAENKESLSPLGTMLARLGSRQIRSLGTLGGNLGTASPIGDMLPPLLALGAEVRLRSQRGMREMPVADFLLGYRRNALAADEVIDSVLLPRVPPGALFVCEKLSKRYDQDISTVSAAFLIEREGDMVRSARLAFGGVGPVVRRALAAEAALIGGAWSRERLDRAAALAAAEIAPLSDLRGTAAYRRAAAAGLLRRLWWRAAGEAADVQGYA